MSFDTTTYDAVQELKDSGVIKNPSPEAEAIYQKLSPEEVKTLQKLEKAFKNAGLTPELTGGCCGF